MFQAIAFFSQNILRVHLLGCGDLFKPKKPQMGTTFDSKKIPRAFEMCHSLIDVISPILDNPVIISSNIDTI